ncbi:MAG: DsrE family protein [Nitrospirae bacterium]|nr:DsrE family protein [Nitrospirota bacterium]MBF0536189.1 DsrE family protein [Nitrospirota bacterium]MBF0618187.1 DsrE family protein [Nitrospirota bacterium]
MSSFVFVLTRGMEDPTRVCRALQLAKVAKEKGHDVEIFLTDDAVFLAKQGLIDHVIAPTGDEAISHLGYLMANNVTIHVCTPCAETRQVLEGDLIENARFGKAPYLIDLAEKSTVFTF